MVTMLLLIAAITLVAFGVGYWLGTLDERKAIRRAHSLRSRLTPYVTVDQFEELRRTRRS